MKSLLATVSSLSFDVQTEHIAFYPPEGSSHIFIQQTDITEFHDFVGIRFIMIKTIEEFSAAKVK